MIDQAMIHLKANSKDQKDRIDAADLFKNAFSMLPDKVQAWQDLHMMTHDKNCDVRWNATDALDSAFEQVPDKNMAWMDLIKLAQDKDSFVRARAADALGSIFKQVPDKDMAWMDLIKLAQDKDCSVRRRATDALGSAFKQVPNKNLAWEDLHKLTQDENPDIRWQAVDALGSAFEHIPEKDLAWTDLHRLTQDENSFVRLRVADALGLVFEQVPDKDLAWMDLIWLTHDENSFVRGRATDALGLVFEQVPDKNLAWNDLHMLTQDENSDVRWRAADALGSAFEQIPDKDLAWRDLYRLSQDKDHILVSLCAAYALGLVFEQVPDKDLAWNDLHILTRDENSDVRGKAAYALGSAFEQVPDKDLAWNDLHMLTQDENSDVRWRAADALGSAFEQILDKDLAWKDLQRLSQDKDSNVRGMAAYAIGSAFSLVPDRSQAWRDLHGLTQDMDSDVRMYAYHALGRASVFKATMVHANDEIALKNELERAITYFERSSIESEYGPARFCHPFYRTYYAIAFQGAKNDEVQKYLLEAKKAVKGSESKDELFKAIENLAGALQEVQRLKEKSISEIASDLKAYRWYCDKAASHMAVAEKSAPGAVKLMKKCNLLLEEKIDATVAEIQKSAKKICQITRGTGTEYEKPGVEIGKAAMALSAGGITDTQRSSTQIVSLLKKFCKILPEEKKTHVCQVIEEIGHESDFPEKLTKIELALSYLSPLLEDVVSSDNQSIVDVVVLTVLPEEYGCVCNKIPELRPPYDENLKNNTYAWKFGNVFCQKFNGNYKLAVGMIGRAGTTHGALAAREVIQLWRPRYIIFSGIAGGFPDSKEKEAHPTLGDVVIADVIYGYEYGKIDKEEFKPRVNWTYRTDQSLLTSALAYSQSNCWIECIRAASPIECKPMVICCEIASGDKVVDNRSSPFFKQVLKVWPKVEAVEMEGAGLASAIEQSQVLGIPTGFMMIRGISDLPRDKGKKRGTKERDAWKLYASDVAAAFIIGWISDGLPVRPSDRSTQR